MSKSEVPAAREDVVKALCPCTRSGKGVHDSTEKAQFYLLAPLASLAVE